MNGLQIIQLREKFNLTQKKLADIIGVTSRTVAGWENGALIPPAMNLLLEMISDESNEKYITGVEKDVKIQSQKTSGDTITMPTGVFDIIVSQQRTIENLSWSARKVAETSGK